MSIDFRSQIGVETWAALWMAASKANIEQHGILPPAAGIAVTVDAGEPVPEGRLAFVPAETPFDEDKRKKWIAEVEHHVATGKAIAVMCAGEGVMYEAEGENAGKEMQVVIVDLQHEELGDHSWVANVLRGDDGVKLTPFQKRAVQPQFGRFIKR